MRRIVTIVTLVGALVTTPGLAAQSPALAGTWILDGFMGRSPLGLRNNRAICVLPAAPVAVEPGAAFDTPDGPQLTPVGTVEGELRISEADGRIIIERRFGGTMGTGVHRDELRPDGSEVTTTHGAVTSHTRARWEKASLVVDLTLTWGQDARGGSCSVREVYSLDAPNSLSVVATNDAVGRSQQTWVRRVR